MTLRPYQADVIESARLALARSNSIVIQMPTGAGKTKVAASMIALKEGLVWFVVHRQEIERQTAAALSAAGIDFGVVSPRAAPDYSKRVQIISIGTLARRIDDIPAPDYVFWDECQHAAAKSWSALIKQLPDAKHIGLTATPERLDGKGLDELFDELVIGPTTRELIDGKHLSEFRYFAPSDPDLTAARVREGDYNKGDISKVMNTPVLIGDAVREYKEKANGKRALVFAASVEASKALVERFNAAGIPAAHVDGKTPTPERDAAIAALAAGDIKVLSNVEIFTEGFDLPSIDAIILMRPTKSLALFLQMIGRVLRTADGKDEALIFDHAALWHDHGWPAHDFKWTLAGDARLRRVAETASMCRRCPACKQVYENRILSCECGFEFPSGREIGEFDNALSEVVNKPKEGEIKISAFVAMLRKHFTEKSQTTELYRIRKYSHYGGYVNVKEELNHLRLANYSFLPPIFSSRAKDYTQPTYRFEEKFGISVDLLELLIGRRLRRHANGWVDNFDAADAVSQIRQSHMRLTEFNAIMGRWRTTRYRLTPTSPALPTINQSSSYGKFNHGPVWINTKKALRWLIDNRPDIKIPPEAWPKVNDTPSHNDNTAASALADAA